MRDLNKAEQLASSAQEPPTSQATETASAPHWKGSAFKWLQENGYKELGQPIHYEQNGHVGYKYPHEILDLYLAAAAPSVAGTQPTRTKEEYEAYRQRNWDWNLPKWEDLPKPGAAQGTPQVEECSPKAVELLATIENADSEEAQAAIFELRKLLPHLEQYIKWEVEDALTGHLPGAPAQLGPEEKR